MEALRYFKCFEFDLADMRIEFKETTKSFKTENTFQFHASSVKEVEEKLYDTAVQYFEDFQIETLFDGMFIDIREGGAIITGTELSDCIDSSMPVRFCKG